MYSWYWSVEGFKSVPTHLPAAIVEAGEGAVGGGAGGALEGGHGGVHGLNQRVDGLVVRLYRGKVELRASRGPLTRGQARHQRQQQERKHRHHCLQHLPSHHGQCSTWPQLGRVNLNQFGNFFALLTRRMMVFLLAIRVYNVFSCVYSMARWGTLSGVIYPLIVSNYSRNH